MLAPALHAATYTVTNTNSGSVAGSFRRALADAEASAGTDTVVFEASLSGQTITITTGIAVNDADGVTVNASSLPAGIVLDGGTGTNRLFFNAATSSLTLIGVTITGGDGDGTNSPGLGGAIFSAGTLTLTDCQLHDNTASGNGGAIHNLGTAALTRCTLSTNSTSAGGGAISNAGTLTATNCTLVGNSADSVSSGGGGVNATSAATSTTLIHCTLTGNAAAAGAGGGARRGGGVFTVQNCIVAENTAATAGLENLGSTVTQTGSNLITTDAPGLSTLGAYGGRVPTSPPLSTSTVIDAVAAGHEVAGLTTDARGHGRALDGDSDGTGKPDIGAVEFIPASFVVVSNTNDAGIGSLRQAIANAALHTGPDTITFAPALSGQTITLTTGQLYLNDFVAIDASALAEPVQIHGNDTFRIFEIPLGANVALVGLTLTHGRAAAPHANFPNGGGIDNQGTLLVMSCCIIANQAIHNGGGIHNGGYLTVQRSTISGNTADGGGGIFNYASSPHVGSVRLTLCTITGNTGVSYGGAVANVNFGATSPCTLISTHCTISNNTAPAGGIVTFDFGGPAQASLENTVLAGNSPANLYKDGAGASCTSLGGNLASDNGGGFLTAPGDLINSDPRLGPLMDNGGPTFTMALLAGSPALDAAVDGEVFTTDQRGFLHSRDGDAVAGARPDIGAYEAQVAPVAAIGFNFAGEGTHALAAVERAGAPAFVQNYWNNMGGDYGHVNAPYGTDGGGSMSVEIWWDSPGTSRHGTPATPDQKLMLGYFDSNGAANSGSSLLNDPNQPFFAINGLPASHTLGGFRVVVYAQPQGNTGSVGEYWISSFANPEDVSATYDLSPHLFLAKSAGDFDGSYTRSTSTARAGASVANHMVFDALTDSGFILRTEDSPSPRAPINAVQIMRNEILVVTTQADENDPNGVLGTGLSLREALRDAPSGAGIVFDPAVFTGGTANTITFATASTALVVARNVTIDASNIPGGITVHASGSSASPRRVLSVSTGCVASLRGITLAGGYVTSNGGGLANLGAVMMTDCSITGNNAEYGGGALSYGRLTLRRCTVSGNEASAGGGVLNWSTGGSMADLRVQDSTVAGNYGSNGGGVYNYSDGGLARATLLRTTICGNSSSAAGGCLNSCYVITATSSMTLSHCTVSGNTAGTGGGCFQQMQFGTATLIFDNCILAQNSASQSPELYLQTGEGYSRGRNVFGYQQGLTWPAVDITVTNPLLAPLGDYGGPTWTMALLPGSPARNGSLDSTATADQRGFSIVGTADIGAYESGTARDFNGWAWETLPASATPAQRVPGHDDDKDGRSLLMEYALLSNPTVPNGGAVLPFTLNAAGTQATLVAPYRPGVPDLIFAIERSTDLASWTAIVTVDNPTQSYGTVSGAAFVSSTSSTLTFMDTFNNTGFAGQPRVFYRLRVAQ